MYYKEDETAVHSIPREIDTMINIETKTEKLLNINVVDVCTQTYMDD